MTPERPESWEKEGQNQRTKKLNFGMGPNVKFVSPICDLISERKNRGNFCIRKKTIKNTGFFSGTLA